MNTPKTNISCKNISRKEMIRQRLFRAVQAKKQPQIAPKSDSFEAILFFGSQGICDGVLGAVTPLTSSFVRTKTLLAKITPCL